MLAYADLVAVERPLRPEHVLSVYIDGRADDPAIQHAWRIYLDQSFKEIKSSLTTAPHAERNDFDQCFKLVEAELSALPRGLGARGWVAFVTKDGIRHSEFLPISVPTMAVWSMGAAVAPYIRALKQTRPVIIAVANAMHATVYSYKEGQLEKSKKFENQASIEPPIHMGDAPRMGMHTGVRGSTGRDNLQRVMRETTAQMLKETAEHIIKIAGNDGWIVTGGIPEVSKHLAQLVTESARGRVLAYDPLHIQASEPEVIAAAKEGASTLRETMDVQRISDVAENINGTKLGVAGMLDTRAALDQSCVRTLYFTHRYLEENKTEVESAVRSALDQGANVEEVARDAAIQLDNYGGIAAQLRFPIQYVVESSA